MGGEGGDSKGGGENPMRENNSTNEVSKWAHHHPCSMRKCWELQSTLYCSPVPIVDLAR